MVTSRILLTQIIHRIDVWGVAFVISAIALILHQAVSLQNLSLAAALMLIYWIGYLLNDYFDVSYDLYDPIKARLNPFIQSSRPVMLAVALVVFVLIVLAFASFGQQGLLLLGGGCFVMWAYSAPPLRLKRLPIFDLVIHALFVQTFAYFTCLLLIDAHWTIVDYWLLAINFLASLAGQLQQQIRDYAVDSQTDTNFTILFGRGRSLWLLRLTVGLLLTLFIIGALQTAIPFWIVPYGVLALPTLIQRLLQKRCSQWITPLIMLLALSYTSALLITTY